MLQIKTLTFPNPLFILVPSATGILVESWISLASKNGLPFNYLGVPIFKGRLKSNHLLLIIDRILAKLSMATRITFVKSCICNMISYSMRIYSRPIDLLRKIEKACKNLISTGGIHNKSLLMVAWKKCCQPLKTVVLDFMSFIKLNEAYNIKHMVGLNEQHGGLGYSS